MTYNPNIPQTTDIPSQSQGEMLTNFQQLNTVFDVDHVPFNDGTAANRGKHDQSTYLELALDPTTAANEMAVYCKDNAGSSTLYLRQESNGAVIQMSGANPTVAASGSTFLPGGLVLKWGILNSPVDNSLITFAGGAFPGNVYSITLTPVRDATAERSMYVKTGSVSTSNFRIRTSSANFDAVYYMAIGD